MLPRAAAVTYRSSSGEAATPCRGWRARRDGLSGTLSGVGPRSGCVIRITGDKQYGNDACAGSLRSCINIKSSAFSLRRLACTGANFPAAPH